MFATLTGILLTLPVFVFAPEIASWFNPQPQLVYWAENYMELMAVAFVFTPVNVVISQSLVARNHLRIPVILDSVVLLGVMSPILIIATLAGAGVKALILVNMFTVVGLTIIYVVVRQRVVKHDATR